MKRQVSTERRPWLRTAVYTFMTLTVTVIVALLMLVVLGYQFNKKDGKLEQGGLLQFQSLPSGATVTLDELKLGSQTTSKATVDSGNHFVTFSLDGYRVWQKSIIVRPGQIGWLNYARLIPQEINTQSLHDYPTLSGALASPNQKYMLLHEAANSPDFTLVNIQGETLSYTALNLPAGSYTVPSTKKPQSFTLDSWSHDDQAVLIRHKYDGNKTEWILLNRTAPAKSVDINASYGIAPSVVQFAGTGNRLLFVQTADMVRRINLDEQTLSRPLVTHVDNFTGYDDKTIVYASTPSKKQRTVGYAAINIDKPHTITTYPADGQPLIGAMASYFGQRYVSIVYGKTLTVLTGALPTSGGKGSLKTFETQAVPAGVSHMTVSDNDRFFVATTPDGYATYDLELLKYDATTWAHKSKVQEPLHWLDDYMLWSDGGGTLRFYEFDGANQQDIMPAAPGFAASLSPNGKYIYDITKTDDGYVLQRAKLILS